MAESQVKEVLENEITCPLCLDIFKEPKKLPCDHVYCKECIRGLAQRGASATISCPECRFLTQPLNNDIDNFPTAFRINRLVQAFHQLRSPKPKRVVPKPRARTLRNTCSQHSTQTLVFYCETCKNCLCSDCVVMTKDHEGHKYGFIKEVAPKYRKEVLGELTNVKTHEASISDALEEVVDAKNGVVSHAGKCQEDIDKAFEEMFSALQQCKQEMKDEARKHYSSLIGVFESKKEQLQGFESELRSVAALAVTLVQDDDQSFLMKVRSTMEKLNDLQGKFETIPLKVIEPQLLTAQAVSSDVLLRYFKTLSSLYNLTNPKTCKVDGMVTEMQVDQQQSFLLTLNDSAEEICKGGENSVHADLVNLQGYSTKGVVETVSMGQVKITITPGRRGQHKLNVKVNGAHIANSPFSVFVNMPPTLISQPITTISRLKNPTGLVYSQGTILAAEKGKNRIVGIDSQLHKQKLAQLADINELTRDLSRCLYATTAMDHKVHKLSEDGRSIKATGRYGKKNGEFNYPNGLRVSKNNELYVCDSGNNRIQVFDLDLNFKRSFGKKGTGKGQFDFPSDVDFSSTGYIYVADNGNRRIQVFAHNERHLQVIANPKPSTTKFDPVRVLIHSNHMYVTDYFNHYVVVINITTGEIVTKFGGEFLNEPEGITVDHDGFVYVTSHHSKIVVF